MRDLIILPPNMETRDAPAPALHELQERRHRRLEAMNAIVTRADGESGRDLTADETREFEAGQTEVRNIDRRIQLAQAMAEDERRQDASPLDGSGRPRELRNYSIARAIQGSMTGRLEGLEAEVHQDLSRGRETRGVMIPAEILLETRVLKTTTPGGGPGSNIIGREMYPVRDHPRPRLLIESLGATVLRNLTGNIDLPVLAQSGTVGWVAEHTAVTRSDPQFGKSSMTPKTVGGEYEVSRRMILQSAESIEDLLRRDLGQLLQQELDRAAINGSGGTQPTGILNTAGIQTVVGTALSSDLTADMIAELELDDLTGTRAFLTNPQVMKAARKTKDGDGHVIPLSELFHGERVEQTTQVPATYSTDKNALIYGQWSELVVGYWSGVDILVNPYHADVASKGGVLIHAFLDADVVVRTPNAFVAAGLA